jgi:hypothetical protein
VTEEEECCSEGKPLGITGTSSTGGTGADTGGGSFGPKKFQSHILPLEATEDAGTVPATAAYLIPVVVAGGGTGTVVVLPGGKAGGTGLALGPLTDFLPGPVVVALTEVEVLAALEVDLDFFSAVVVVVGAAEDVGATAAVVSSLAIDFLRGSSSLAGFSDKAAGTAEVSVEALPETSPAEPVGGVVNDSLE